MSAGDRRAAVLEGMAKYVGPRALEAVDLIETDWSAEEWTRGAYGTSFGLGGLTRFGEDLRRPIGPIHWACTDIAGVGHIHMEGAVRSGRARRQGLPRGGACVAGAVRAPARTAPKFVRPPDENRISSGAPRRTRKRGAGATGIGVFVRLRRRVAFCRLVDGAMCDSTRGRGRLRLIARAMRRGGPGRASGRGARVPAL